MTYPEYGQCNLFFFGFLNLCFHFLSVGLISNNLLFSLLFQRCCLCCSIYSFILILKAVCDILNFFSVVRFMVDLAALSAWFPLMLGWLGTWHICISLSFDTFFNLQIILVINGWSNFLFFCDSNIDSESENMMNLLFLDSEMRSRAILIAQASALNIEVSLTRCFLKSFPLYIVAHPVILSTLDPSVKMCKCLGYFSLTFSNSSWKIRGWVLFLWNLRSVKIMFGFLIVQGGISGMIVLWISIRSTSASPMIVSIRRTKVFMTFSFFWNSSLYLGWKTLWYAGFVGHDFNLT